MAGTYQFVHDEHALRTVGRTPDALGDWTCTVSFLAGGKEVEFCVAVGANALVAESRAARIVALLNEGWSK